MPAKGVPKKKLVKAWHYIRYLARVLFYLTRNRRSTRVAHFQFFRNERIESLLFPLLRLAGVRLVFTAHNVVPHESNRLDQVSRRVIYGNAQAIIVHSQYIKDKLILQFKVSPQKIWVIPHGHFDHYLPDQPLERSQARATLGLDDRDQVVMFFGFIRAYKGLDLLLDGFAQASRQNGRLKLVIAGAAQSRQMEDQYRARIERDGLQAAVIYRPGYVAFEDVARYFAAADLVALPYSAIDHSGIVHLAYSFGKPVIATRVGDFPEMIETGRSGFLLARHDADCMAQTLLDIFSGEHDLAAMGAYARELSATKYSWLEIAKKTRAVYEAK
jgi:glycosyltransferase involved in cell wall biosynthesis